MGGSLSLLMMSQKHRNLPHRFAIALVAVSISACAVAKPPIEQTSQVVAIPVQGDLSVALSKAPTVGEVTPVNVSVANGTYIPRTVVPSQIFAINQSGQRIAPLPPGEAARQAGGAGELKAALSAASREAQSGAGLGAAVGAVTGGVLRRHLKATNKSWRVDETYIRVSGRWSYLYRAIDSTGATIDFLLSALRDAAAAERLFRKALSDPSHPQPRVINTDKARLYDSAIAGVKEEGTLRRRCRHRPVQYLNNILEQDHRAIKRRVKAKQNFREFQAARRTIEGY
jgi:DDE domain